MTSVFEIPESMEKGGPGVAPFPLKLKIVIQPFQ